LNVHRASDVRQIEIHTAEPSVPDSSPFEVQIVTEKLKRYKSPSSYQIPGKLIQTAGAILHSEIHMCKKIKQTFWHKFEDLNNSIH
jgi:hypothetical protein